ncbi:flagellar export protein FliJ [Ruminiclostridium herbifermentans]|uniref:Flagellar FliJ protein n=1 Tax=Ruminiclostridium herbifermentans TaxID=2488810 RepID=A0A4U7JNF5_9FIRM|nr:flagellar export protein FliJ [Ruminiclostridium herbifermentans]QNU68388.1 flagellar export protein FliJ [Ruminiclostridium herbifermentans]
MQKFSFRLQSVLKLKEQLEDNAKNNLARATKELETQKFYLEELMNENDASINSLTEEVYEGIPVYRVRLYNNYLSLMKEKIVNQKENVNIAEHNVDTNREALIKAMQERKVLEKLKDKKYDEYLKDQNKAEQVGIDELNSFKFKDI